jgi:hypothetical protein
MNHRTKLSTILILALVLMSVYGCDKGKDDNNPAADVAAVDQSGPQDVLEETNVSMPDATVGPLAQADFDDVELGADSFWDGSDESGAITSGGVTFLNNYNTEYMSWDGYAVSNMTDTTTPGWNNQFSAITGSGHDGSANYGIGYDGTPLGAATTTFIISDAKEGLVVGGLYVTNATYPYLSMLEGDELSKKFGGETGSDPDWFKLTLTGLDKDNTACGTVEFFLADFTSESPAEDYIINEWTFVDLTSLGPVVAVEARLSSSDIGEWGMNTPAYFAIDNIAPPAE